MAGVDGLARHGKVRSGVVRYVKAGNLFRRHEMNERFNYTFSEMAEVKQELDWIIDHKIPINPPNLEEAYKDVCMTMQHIAERVRGKLGLN
jgi:hypothetical protein